MLTMVKFLSCSTSTLDTPDNDNVLFSLPPFTVPKLNTGKVLWEWEDFKNFFDVAAVGAALTLVVF